MEFNSAELVGSGGGGDGGVASVGGGLGSEEPTRTLKRPRLAWIPQLQKRFMDAKVQTNSVSQFESFKNLQGYRKGDNVEGLYQVKKYLDQFGYLDVLDNKNSEFDDKLESAIMTYQLKFNLNVTGILDSRTVSQMMMPRCGEPDM
ncbi:Hypothetical predicted protein [Olea europaea subsp. europaea]|uniref:Peptidoglycan binding-like domain-containing protein n=1 Tax=Olea europaea subsp. europaea TaxID=158383 RepID=A0A8S0S4T5_OLEEU|nr:Hypothetical predicted protein [Olea europaea subsp. europaea]